MVQAVIITDTHLFEKHTRADSLISCNYEDVYNVCSQAIQLAKENNLKEVFHAGDFFDSRKHQSQSLLQMAENIFQLFEDNQITLYIINGNHDSTDYESSYSFLSPYKHHPFIKLIPVSHFIDLETTRIHLLSFFDNDRYIKELEEVKTKLSDKLKNVLITHIGIHGALRNNGEKEQSSITFEMFKEFDKVLIGHYHNLSSHINGKVVYIGASLQHNFGEDNNKGVTLLTDRLKLNKVQASFKEYKNFEVDVASLTKEDIQDLISIKDETHSKVILTGDPNLIKAFDKKVLLEAGIKVDVRAEVIAVQQVTQEVEAHTNDSILDSFKTFCQEHNYPVEEGEEFLKPIIERNV